MNGKKYLQYFITTLKSWNITKAHNTYFEKAVLNVIIFSTI